MPTPNFHIPEYLKQGDTIGLAATARKISSEELKPALDWLVSLGFKYKLSPTLFEQDNQLAGAPEKRAFGFQTLLDDPEVKAIWIVRGGYGTVQVIDLLDFTSFNSQPKWIVGYSDITVLHGHLHQLGICSMHADMPINFLKPHHEKQEAKLGLSEALFGNLPSVPIQTNRYSKNGNAEGILIGGNLSVLYSLLQSSSFPSTHGKILFIEDLDEYLYHIDRMMYALKRAGALNNLSALVVGGMTDMNDNTIPFGKSAIEIILDITQPYNYPVVFGLQAGHISQNTPLIFGENYQLTPQELIPVVK